MMRYITVSTIAVIVLFAWTSTGEEPNQVAAFMRTKLARSQELLEGIALEDYAKIKDNSQAISRLCDDERWQVLLTPDYVAHSERFRRAAILIAEAADEKNLDGAALSYIALTMQCVECHKYVRDVRTARLDLDDAFGAKAVAVNRETRQ